MGWCKIGEKDGAKAIADLILFNTSLTTLDLRGNSLGNAGESEACDTVLCTVAVLGMAISEIPVTLQNCCCGQTQYCSVVKNIHTHMHACLHAHHEGPWYILVHLQRVTTPYADVSPYTETHCCKHAMLPCLCCDHTCRV